MPLQHMENKKGSIFLSSLRKVDRPPPTQKKVCEFRPKIKSWIQLRKIMLNLQLFKLICVIFQFYVFFFRLLTEIDLRQSSQNGSWSYVEDNAPLKSHNQVSDFITGLVITSIFYIVFLCQKGFHCIIIKIVNLKILCFGL